MIRKIAAKGNMVEITSDENGAVLIDRREALKRAKAIIGIDKDSQWLVEALVKAANEARITETGKGYKSESMDLLMKTAADQAKKLPS